MTQLDNEFDDFVQLLKSEVGVEPWDDRGVNELIYLWFMHGRFAYQTLTDENIASVIDDPLNDTRLALNKAIATLNGVVYAEMFGITHDPNVDVSSLLQEANDVAEATGARLVVTGDYGAIRIDGNVRLTVDTDIQCPIHVTDGGSLRFGNLTSFDSLNFTDLTDLTEFSSQIGGLPSIASGRYLWIESDEVLTERNNPPNNIPYYKRSAVYVLDSTGRIAPTLDMTYNNGYNVSVKLFHKETRINIKLHSLHSINTSGTTNFELILQRDNIDFKLGNMTSAGAQFRASISVLANGCRLTCPRVDASLDVGAGQGYGVAIGLSCKTEITGLTGGDNRETLSGRHGSLVTVRDAIGRVCDTHWGNDYRFINCDLGSIQWAGKDLTIEGGSLSAVYPVNIRADVLLATGTLYIRGVKVGPSSTRLVGPSSQITTAASIFSTPRRMFDSVIIKDVEVKTSANFILYVTDFALNSGSSFVFNPPRRISIDDISALDSSTFTAISVSAIASATLDYTPLMSVRNVDTLGRHPLVMGRGFSDSIGPAHGIKFKISDCGEIHPQIDSNLISRLDIVRCDTQIRRINSKTFKGGIFLQGGYISNSSGTEPENPVTAVGTILLDNSSSYSWAGRRGCFATAGIPIGFAADFSNPTYYTVPT